MKASELITQLEQMVELAGDVEVIIGSSSSSSLSSGISFRSLQCVESDDGETIEIYATNEEE